MSKTWFQNDQKLPPRKIKKWSKIHPKIGAKITKHRSKIDQKLVPGAALRAFWAPGATGTLPGPSWNALGDPPGPSWGRSWAQLGPNLSQHGANLGPSRGNLEPTWGQVEPKLPLESHLGRSWGHLEASWSMWSKRSQILFKKWSNYVQKSMNIYPKNIKNTLL